MDITTLAAWSEFLGGISVVVSLVYLAGQIRQHTRLLQVSATVAAADSERLFTRAVVDDPVLRLTTFWTAAVAIATPRNSPPRHIHRIPRLDSPPFAFCGPSCALPQASSRLHR
jgi:hypothetical protein